MTPTSGVEFLVWLLIVAAIIAMIAKRLRIPYTVSLVVGGVLLGALHIPLPSPLQPRPLNSHPRKETQREAVGL